MKSNRLKVSVALCTYNGARFLSEQLESIAAQTHLPDEVVVCDDGSSDGTLGVVAQFARTVPFLVSCYKNLTQLGVTKNFERAISLCTGDVIFLCDQDDVWMPQKIEKMAAAFQANYQIGLVFSNGFVVDSKLNKLGYKVWDVFGLDEKSQRAITGGDPLSFFIRRYAITGATMAFRASLKDKFLPIPEVWIHDAWITCLAASMGSIVTVAEPLIMYRQHEANVIGGRRISISARYIKAIEGQSRKVNIEIMRLVELLKSIKIISGLNVTSQHVIEVNNKIDHLVVRKNIYKESMIFRVHLIVKEIFTTRYHRCSNGFSSAMVDFFVKKDQP